MEKYYFLYYKVEGLLSNTDKQWYSTVSNIHPFQWIKDAETLDNKKRTLINFHQIKKSEYDLYMSLNPQ